MSLLSFYTLIDSHVNVIRENGRICKKNIALRGGGCMKKSNYFAAEFKRLVGKKSVLISVGIALLVPLIYAMIMLSPKWGPYDNLDNLPVAVVNNDEGALSDGELINIGDNLIESLQDNQSLGWEFVSPEQAQKGMDDMKYYMTIEVPENFSEKALTVLDDHPQRPELKFTQNEGLHFMAAQVTDSAVETVQGQLSAQITETYVETVFSQLDDVADGFSEGADGAEQINDGTTKLKDGSEEMLTSLTEKSSDIGRLADGAKELNDGTQTLKDSLVGKQSDISTLAAGSRQLNAGTRELVDNLTNKSGDISKLADGSKQLNEGTAELLGNLKGKSSDISKLADGAKQVNDGTGLLLSTLNEKSTDISKLSSGASELSSGASELQSGSNQLLEGAQTAKNGSAQLKAGLEEQLAPGSEELAAGVKRAQDGVNETINSMNDLHESLKFLSTLDKDHPVYDGVLQEVLGQLEEGLKDTPQKQADFERLVQGANTLRDGLQKGSEFNAGLTQLDAGLGEIVAGQKELNKGASELANGAKQVAEGNKTVASGWNELQDNVEVLHAGTQQVADGNQTVKSGWQELSKGAEQLHDGSSQISEGNQTVENGWQELTVGATQLHDGSSQISEGNQTVESGWRELSAGTTELHDGSTQIKDGNATVKEGWVALTDGVTQVDGGLSQLLDGSEELHEGLQGGAEQAGGIDPQQENITMFAEPVVLDGEVINSFPFYRDANAPYVITLALFVGVLAMSFVVSYRKPAILPPSAISWFSGKIAKLTMLAVAQALIISLYSLLILKIDVHSSFTFILFTIWVSLTFLMIVLFLVALAGNIGRFIALAFAVIQLSTTGSDLPIHMLPEGLRNLSVFLPFTYSIDGFKNVITLGSTSTVWANMGILFIYIGTFGLLSALVFIIRYRRVKEELIHEEDTTTESAI